jgi:MFS family permease
MNNKMSNFDIKRNYKKTMLIISICQVLSGMGIIAGISTGTQLAIDILDITVLTGLPFAIVTLGSAFGSLSIGNITNKYGRRIGLSFGFLISGISAIFIIISIIFTLKLVMIISLFVYGFGTAANLQARFASSDVASKNHKSKALGLTFAMTTIGCIICSPLSMIVEGIFHIPNIIILFIISSAAFLLSGLLILILLKPDPLLISRIIHNNDDENAETHNSITTISKNVFIVSILIMLSTQLIMKSVMSMSPIHIQHFGGTMSMVSFVVGIHLTFMYFPSIFVGNILEKLGYELMNFIAILTIIVGCILSFSFVDGMFLQVILPLMLIGLGWNIGLITGSTALLNYISQSKLAKYQGYLDLSNALIGALISVISGIILTVSNLNVLITINLIIGVLVFILLLKNYIFYVISTKKTYI